MVNMKYIEEIKSFLEKYKKSAIITLNITK